jgi:hypothetical protein
MVRSNNELPSLFGFEVLCQWITFLLDAAKGDPPTRAGGGKRKSANTARPSA